MNIDKRLRAIINEIDGNVLADVGCDHGKVTFFAIKEKRVKKVIATDISQKSLDKCVDLINKAKFKNVEFRCGDGLEVIKDNEVDIVCIAGMGGYETIKILSNAPKGIKKLVLCPHQDVEALRDYLKDNWYLDKDYTVFFGKHFYNVIVCTKGSDSLSKKQMLLGKDDLSNKDYVKKLDALKEKYTKIQAKNIPSDKYNQCEEYLSLIREELNGSKKDI